MASGNRSEPLNYTEAPENQRGSSGHKSTPRRETLSTPSTNEQSVSDTENPKSNATNLVQGFPSSRCEQAAEGPSEEQRKGTSQVHTSGFDDSRNSQQSTPEALKSWLAEVIDITKFLPQQDGKSIPQKPLGERVKETYAGLFKVEEKCRRDHDQAAVLQDLKIKRSDEHWQAKTALHRTLLGEHYAFLFLSQHPSASPKLRGLVAKHNMLKRMWFYCIEPYLKILQKSLPDSNEHMLEFIYLAYEMMALLYETVPAFQDIFMECLGDLARYRMAIEDEDEQDRATWAGVARSWYTKVADKNPIIGRLYHHLAILARPNALQQMYYYSLSLTCVKPFESSRESILNLLNPILGRTTVSFTQALPIDACFIKSHGLQFLGDSVKGGQTSEDFLKARTEFLDGLNARIGRVSGTWKHHGVWIAVTNIAGWFDYGVDNNALRQAFLIDLSEKAKKSGSNTVEESQRITSSMDQPNPPQPSVDQSEIGEKLAQLTEQLTFKNARLLSNDTFALALRRVGDKNVLPYVNIKLAFILSFASNPYVPDLFDDLPWTDLIAFLNALLEAKSKLRQPPIINQTKNIDSLLAEDLFPADGERPNEIPLPEDFLCRGLIWTHGYFPKGWFSREQDEEERYSELEDTVDNRTDRVLRLGYALTKCKLEILYDPTTQSFKAASLAS